MRKEMKSKIKRRILGLVSAVSVFVFSVTPAFAAETDSSNEAAIAANGVAVQDVNTPEAAEMTKLIDMANSVDPATLPETTSEIAVKDEETGQLIPRAGTETWTGSGLGGNYTFRDSNLTPVKTMGKSGTLLIYGSFYGDDGYADVSPIKLTAQIRSTSGTVKSQTIRTDNRSGSTSFSMSATVYAGEQIQLFFDASSVANPPGILRSAHVTYYYDLY